MIDRKKLKKTLKLFENMPNIITCLEMCGQDEKVVFFETDTGEIGWSIYPKNRPFENGDLMHIANSDRF